MTDSIRVGRELSVEERRTAVLRAALVCIAAQGSDNVRLKDISREAKVSVGLLQHYFESRDQLVAMAFRLASEDLLENWASLALGENPWQRLMILIDHVVDRESLRDRCLIWIEFATAAARRPAERDGFSTIYRRWEEIVGQVAREGVRTGHFRPIMDVDDAVELMLEHIDGTILRVASGIYPPDKVAMKRSIVRLCESLLVPIEPN